MDDVLSITIDVVIDLSIIFVIITSILNCIIIYIVLKHRNDAFANFFFRINAIAQAVDTFSLVLNHCMLVPPAKGWLLEYYLFSMIPGRVFIFVHWLARMNQSVIALAIGLNRVTAFLAPTLHTQLWAGSRPIIVFVLFQVSLGSTVGIALGSGPMEWAQAANGGWFLHFPVSHMTEVYLPRVFIVKSLLVLSITVCYTVIISSFCAGNQKSTTKKKKSEFSLMCVAFAVSTGEILHFVFFLISVMMSHISETDLRAFFINHFVCTNLTSITPYLLLLFCRSLRLKVKTIASRHVFFHLLTRPVYQAEFNPWIFADFRQNVTFEITGIVPCEIAGNEYYFQELIQLQTNVQNCSMSQNLRDRASFSDQIVQLPR